MKNFELNEEEAIKLGTYLKNRREKLGYSTNYIEMYTGINKADISRIENGKKKKINPLYLKELANILKLNQIELFNIAGFIEDKYLQLRNTLIENLIEIPVYASVSAGCGRIPEREPIDYISLPEVTSDCIAIKVEGESMEPTLSPGDLIVLKKEMEVKIGDIGVFLDKNSGESFVKRLKNKNGNYILESDNSLFEDIELKSDNLVCCGKVINVVKSNLKNKKNQLQELFDEIPSDKIELAKKLLKTLIS